MSQTSRNRKRGRPRIYEYSVWQQLYDAGCNDCEIARQTGALQSSVWRWRVDRGLRALVKPTDLIGGIRADRLREAIASGVTENKRLAQIAGCIPAYVRAFRQREARRAS